MRAQEIVVINDMSVPELDLTTTHGYAERVRHETRVRLGEKASSGYVFAAFTPQQAGDYAYNFTEQYDDVCETSIRNLTRLGIHKPEQAVEIQADFVQQAYVASPSAIAA